MLYIVISLLLDITGSEMGRLRESTEWQKRQRGIVKIGKRSVGKQSTEFKDSQLLDKDLHCKGQDAWELFWFF